MNYEYYVYLLQKKKEFVNVICFMAYGAKSPVSGRARKHPWYSIMLIF